MSNRWERLDYQGVDITSKTDNGGTDTEVGWIEVGEKETYMTGRSLTEGLESTRQVILTWFVSTEYSISHGPLSNSL